MSCMPCVNAKAEVHIPNMPNGGDTGAAMEIAETILGYIQFLAFAVAVGMVLVIGIKYMMSGANGVAKVKDTLMPYLIGAIIAGGASGITQFVIDMVGD